MVSSAPPRSRQGRQVNILQAFALLLAFALMAVLGGVLSAALVMPAVAGASAVTDRSVALFEDLPDELEQVPLPEKSTILAADGTVLATFFVQNRVVVGLDQISQPMKDAVVSTEDRRFFSHSGVDLPGLTRAAIRNVTTEDTEGGSTLTQQYIKNALIQAALTSEDPQARADAIAAARESEGIEGYARKLQEAKLAISLEERMTKEEILEAYLNIAQFGNSVYGVEAAAQAYFSIPAAHLNFVQAATIAGVTQAPSEWDPFLNPEGSEERRNAVMLDMLREGKITPADYETGLSMPLVDTLVPSSNKLDCSAANAVASAGYFCDYVTKVIRNDATFGETAQDRVALLYRGGLTITTTLDPRMQEIADTEVKNGIPVDDPSGVASAISVVEPGTGKILAMAQNRIYNAATDAPPGQTAVNYNTDHAYGSSSGFAPGSTLKPFTLVQWLKEGHGLRERIDARLRPYEMEDFDAPCTNLSPGEYEFGNSEGDGGVMTVLDATRNSVNSGYIEMASQLDLCGIFDTAASLGVHRATDGAQIDPLPANVLGSQEVSPLTMAAAFAAFASGGVYCEPIAITGIVDTVGAELPVPQADCRQAISPEIAAAMNHALGQVWQGTARAVGPLPDRPSSGKTGTTSRNENTWFVGHTPQMAAAVWVGYSEGFIPVQFTEINGRYFRYVYGSSIAAPTWKRFMTRAHEGLPVVGFPEPRSEQLNGRAVQVPRVDGRTPGSARSALESAGFDVVIRSGREDSDQREGRVARSDPAGGARAVPGSVIELIISDGPAGR